VLVTLGGLHARRRTVPQGVKSVSLAHADAVIAGDLPSTSASSRGRLVRSLAAGGPWWPHGGAIAQPLVGLPR
jgi:hypothetical protein